MTKACKRVKTCKRVKMGVAGVEVEITAENMYVIQSLLATCRNHDVNPRLYLNSVIASMPYFERAYESGLIQLLTHRWKNTILKP